MRDSPSSEQIRETLVPTVFHEPWWLDAACAGANREVTVSAGGSLVGRLPFLSRKIAGRTVLTMPMMTHVLGPAVAFGDAGGRLPQALKQLSITRDLIARLPRASHIWFRLHGGITNTLAFDAAGFSNGADFTVEIPPAPAETLWRQMRDKTRNVIRRARERLEVVESAEVNQFLDFYNANLQARGLRNAYDRDICGTIIAESMHRRVGRVLAAREPSGAWQAAIFTVWDREAEYYFMSTRVPWSMSGATSLLIWAAIQHAALKSLTFDMDGIHVVRGTLPNLLLLTGFGGTVKPRFLVHKSSAGVLVARHIKDLVTKASAVVQGTLGR